MKKESSHWLAETLVSLRSENPSRYESIVQSLRVENPDLFEELCLLSVGEGILSQSECAEILAIDTRSLGLRLACHSQQETESRASMLERDSNGIAKLKGTHITVWEITREFRKHNSVKTLNEAYAGLTEKELRAALQYAGQNPDEISAQIRDYESRFSSIRTD